MGMLAIIDKFLACHLIFHVIYLFFWLMNLLVICLFII